MTKTKMLMAKYYRLRSSYYRTSRIIWPSPAEVKFIRVMGGRVITFPFMRHYGTKFKPAIVLSLGKILRRECMRREVRVAAKFCDFGNDIKRGIEVDGRYFHDIIERQERDEYFAQYDWRILHIDAVDVWRKPDVVRQSVIDFLAD